MTSDDDQTLDYDARDHEIVDYQSFHLPGSPRVRLRGPEPDMSDGNWFSCIGAAQTMGVYVERPYPVLVADRLGLHSLNLGIGAGWPAFFTDDHPELLERAARGRFVILQAMSARGGATSWFEPTGVERLRDRSTGRVVSSVQAFARVLGREPDRIEQYVAELRESWVRTNLELISRLDVPVILFWFSTRSPDEEPSFSLEGNLFENMGAFPQFVDQASLDEVASHCVGSVHCTSTRNLGHELVSRFTGDPVFVDHGTLFGGSARAAGTPGSSAQLLSPARNEYYPSPEMHDDAADALVAGIRDLIDDVVAPG